MPASISNAARQKCSSEKQRFKTRDLLSALVARKQLRSFFVFKGHEKATTPWRVRLPYQEYPMNAYPDADFLSFLEQLSQEFASGFKIGPVMYADCRRLLSCDEG